MAAEFDIFLSHAWKDGERPQHIADALTAAGLRVWFDAHEIDDFASITRAVSEGLAKSKALLAYYSKTYPLRRACQWELTAAFLAAQTEGDPRRRVLVINPESGADHIHPIELRDAKFLNAPNTDAEMQQLVAAIVKQAAQLSGPLADIHPLTAPNWYGMSPVGSTRFVGRLKEMWEVHSLLSARDVTQITGATVNVGQLSGLGGVGKSLLAEEYALHFGAAYPAGVFWLRAYGNDDAKFPFGPEPRSNLSIGGPTDSPRTSRAAAAFELAAGVSPRSSAQTTEPRSGDTLGPEAREALRTDQMRAMAERLGMETHGLTAEQIEGALSRKIASENKACLWVVDDVPNGLDGDALRRWFAPHALARTLITTRSREYGSLAKGIDLSVLTPDEAYQLLTSRRQPNGDAEKEQAHGLANDLGYHALALDVTASALLSSVTAKPFDDFRAKLARPDKDALALAEALADALPNGHEKSIAQTMLRSIRALGAEGLDFLRLASVLAVAPIPAALVTAVFKRADKLSHEDAEERASLAFKQVTSASLAELAGENKDARSVHTLVSRAMRFHEKVGSERTQALRAAAVEALRAEIARAAADPRLHRQIEFHVAHARQVVSMLESVPQGNLLSWLARYDYERGSYASARAIFERELEFRRDAQGEEHPDTLRARLNLAATLQAQGDLAGARQQQEQVLEASRRLLGEEHPDTLRARLNLAQTMQDQGDLAGARQQQEQVLEARRRLLGEEHPATSNAAWSLFRTLQDLGEREAARAVLERDLRWLLDRDPATLGADQCKIREYVAQVVKKSG